MTEANFPRGDPSLNQKCSGSPVNRVDQKTGEENEMFHIEKAMSIQNYKKSWIFIIYLICSSNINEKSKVALRLQA